jgi:hypothetical protein
VVIATVPRSRGRPEPGHHALDETVCESTHIKLYSGRMERLRFPTRRLLPFALRWRCLVHDSLDSFPPSPLGLPLSLDGRLSGAYGLNLPLPCFLAALEHLTLALASSLLRGAVFGDGPGLRVLDHRCVHTISRAFVVEYGKKIVSNDASTNVIFVLTLL